jgi:hypothetical protein
MIIANSNGQFFIVPSQDMMYFPLELFASSLKNQKLVAVPTCQFLIFTHLLLFQAPRRVNTLVHFRHQVLVKAYHSEKGVLEREALWDY